MALRLFCILAFLLCSFSALAQSPSSVSGNLGKVIPEGPDGVTEIFGVGGLRYTSSGSGNSQMEYGTTFGAAGAILWQDLYFSTRYNMVSYGFTNHIGVGLDFIRYRSAVTQTNDIDELIVDQDGNPVLKELTKTALGLHVNGGLTAAIVPPAYFRADMKLNFTPDLILTITAGLEWRFGETSKSPAAVR
jgi:hypothetical protein